MSSSFAPQGGGWELVPRGHDLLLGDQMQWEGKSGSEGDVNPFGPDNSERLDPPGNRSNSFSEPRRCGSSGKLESHA